MESKKKEGKTDKEKVAIPTVNKRPLFSKNNEVSLGKNLFFKILCFFKLMINLLLPFYPLD